MEYCDSVSWKVLATSSVVVIPPTCTSCSVSCGGGTRTCTRADCSSYTESCGTQPCISDPSNPTISLSPTSLSITKPHGNQNFDPKTFTIRNSGSGVLSWSYNDNASWMSSSKSSGSLSAGLSENITITGDYFYPSKQSGEITISDSNATNNPQKVPVDLEVLGRVEMSTTNQENTSNGTVTSNPSGIIATYSPTAGARLNCNTPNNCKKDFPFDSTVTLTANPSADSVFDFWRMSNTVSDATCVGNVCTMKITKNASSFYFEAIFKPVASAPTVTLSATTSTITYNGSTVISWSTTNATTCTASGAWLGTQAVNGSVARSKLKLTDDYTLKCTGQGGETTKTITVTVNYPENIQIFSSADQVLSLLANNTWKTMTLPDTYSTYTGRITFIGICHESVLTVDNTRGQSFEVCSAGNNQRKTGTQLLDVTNGTYQIRINETDSPTSKTGLYMVIPGY